MISQNFLNSLKTNGMINNALGDLHLFHPSAQVLDIGLQDHPFSSRNDKDDKIIP